MSFPLNIYMNCNQDDTYWGIEEVLYEGLNGSCVFIHCSSELENNCKNCPWLHDCNRLKVRGKQLLERNNVI